MNDQPSTSGFTTGLDRKIEASKRRAAEERAAAGHGKPPTQGLTDLASTESNNIPARKPAPAAFTLAAPDMNSTVRERLRVVMNAIKGREWMNQPVPPEWLEEQHKLGKWCELDFGKAMNWTLRTAIKQLGRKVDRNITSVGYGVERVTGSSGEVCERVVFDPPVSMQAGDVIHVENGRATIKRAEDTKAIIEELAPYSIRVDLGVPIQPFNMGAAETINMIPKPHRRIPIDQVCTVAEAFERLKLAMQQDHEYARGWHANLAMAFYDAEQDDTFMTELEHADNAASLFMERCFDVDIDGPERAVTFNPDVWARSNRKAFSNQAVPSSLDAQLAAAKAEAQAAGPDEPARLYPRPAPDILGAVQTIEQRYAAQMMFLGAVENLTAAQKRALDESGVNEQKARALERMGFGSAFNSTQLREAGRRFSRADGSAPEKADLSDADNVTITRMLTLDELDHILDKAQIGQSPAPRFYK